jgi:hypothetical protein
MKEKTMHSIRLKRRPMVRESLVKIWALASVALAITLAMQLVAQA